MRMPRSLVGSDLSGLAHVYFTNDQPVGRTGPNERADVFLVQYLLWIATSGNIYWPTPISNPSPLVVARVGGTRGLAPPSPDLPKAPGGEEIVIDGYCGDQTIRFIEFFQQQMLSRGEHIHVDGLVRGWFDPQKATIMLLNQALSRSSWGGPRKWHLMTRP